MFFGFLFVSYCFFCLIFFRFLWFYLFFSFGIDMFEFYSDLERSSQGFIGCLNFLFLKRFMAFMGGC